MLIDYGAIPVLNFQTDKALALFNEAMAINAQLRQQNPEDANLKKTRARGLRILSKAQSGKGNQPAGSRRCAKPGRSAAIWRSVRRRIFGYSAPSGSPN